MTSRTVAGTSDSRSFLVEEPCQLDRVEGVALGPVVDPLGPGRVEPVVDGGLRAPVPWSGSSRPRSATRRLPGRRAIAARASVTASLRPTSSWRTVPTTARRAAGARRGTRAARGRRRRPTGGRRAGRPRAGRARRPRAGRRTRRTAGTGRPAPGRAPSATSPVSSWASAGGTSTPCAASSRSGASHGHRAGAAPPSSLRPQTAMEPSSPSADTAAQLLGEAGLADAGLALDDDELGVAPGVGEGVEQGGRARTCGRRGPSCRPPVAPVPDGSAPAPASARVAGRARRGLAVDGGRSSAGSWSRIADSRSRRARLGSMPSSSRRVRRRRPGCAAPRPGGPSGTGRGRAALGSRSRRGKRPTSPCSSETTDAWWPSARSASSRSSTTARRRSSSRAAAFVANSASGNSTSAGPRQSDSASDESRRGRCGRRRRRARPDPRRRVARSEGGRRPRVRPGGGSRSRRAPASLSRGDGAGGRRCCAACPAPTPVARRPRAPR